MKVQLEGAKNEKYPYIGKHNSFDLIVLFVSKEEGVCLHSADEGSKMGEFSDVWDEDSFVSYNKTIRISND